MVEAKAAAPCFFCASPASHNHFRAFENSSSAQIPHEIFNTYKSLRDSCSTSLCTALDLDCGIFEAKFAKANFCFECHELVLKADFTLRAITKLTVDLENVRESLKCLLRERYKTRVNNENADYESDAEVLDSVIHAIGIKGEEGILCGAQLSKIAGSSDSEFVLKNKPSSRDRLQELKKRHEQALKARATKSRPGKIQKQKAAHNLENGGGATYDCKTCGIKFQDNWKFQRHLRSSAHFKSAEGATGVAACSNTHFEISMNSMELDADNFNFEVSNDADTCDDSLQNGHVKPRSHRIQFGNRTKSNFECKICHAQFCDNWKLRRHFRSRVHSPSAAQIIKNNRAPRTVPCAYCAKKFKTEEILTNHIRLHHRQHYHNCVFCAAKHSDRQSYVAHLNAAHASQKLHLCQVCGKTFFFLTELRYHARYHADEGKVSVQCAVCNMTLPSDTLLKSHMISRHPDGGALSMYTCPEAQCNLRFSSASGLQAHVRYLHSRRNDFECTFPGCTKRFGLQTKLDIHFVTHCEGTHLCPVEGCPKRYRHKKDLRAHLQRVHPEGAAAASQGKFPCGVCGKTYFRRDVLRRHAVLKGHYGDQKPPLVAPQPPPEGPQVGEAQCHICHLVLVDAVALKRHYFTHVDNESRAHACPECDKRFSTEEKATAHLKRAHHGSFDCDFCGKRFARNNRLRMHMLSHSDLREHKCDSCEKGYKHERDLILHVRREHTQGNTERFSCGVCDKKFHRSDLLRYHQVRKHGLSAPAEVSQPTPQPTN